MIRMLAELGLFPDRFKRPLHCSKEVDELRGGML